MGGEPGHSRDDDGQEKAEAFPRATLDNGRRLISWSRNHFHSSIIRNC